MMYLYSHIWNQFLEQKKNIKCGFDIRLYFTSRDRDPQLQVAKSSIEEL